MKQTGRPMSPHVTIYAFPPVALSSITNRVTGIAMAGAFAGLSTVELLLGSGSALELTQAIGSSSSVLVQSAAKFGVAFPITYHYLGALRHFAWDAKPDLLTNSDVEKSSYQLLGAATVVAGALMFI
jgi:succinate dehydrogenase (ubiquinone) cytochrome b560 subunit